MTTQIGFFDGGVFKAVDSSTPLPVSGVAAAPGTGTVTSVASSITNVVLLAAATARKGAMVYNESTAILYLKLGTTASATSYTTQLAPNAYYEVPEMYTGIISGIWVAANGSARVTALT